MPIDTIILLGEFFLFVIMLYIVFDWFRLNQSLEIIQDRTRGLRERTVALEDQCAVAFRRVEIILDELRALESRRQEELERAKKFIPPANMGGRKIELDDS